MRQLPPPVVAAHRTMPGPGMQLPGIQEPLMYEPTLDLLRAAMIERSRELNNAMHVVVKLQAQLAAQVAEADRLDAQVADLQATITKLEAVE